MLLSSTLCFFMLSLCSFNFKSLYSKAIVGNVRYSLGCRDLYCKFNNIGNFRMNENKEFFIRNDEFMKDKKLISISPGGYKGFYLLGINTYIKENYSLENFIFSGASAGAWNALFMTYKGDPYNMVLNILDDNVKKVLTAKELEYIIKYKLLTTYKDEDFDLRRLFIGVTTFDEKFKINAHIYSDFKNLEDALNCCIASSHIPFVTGGFTNKYHNLYSFDGAFSSYPYLDKITPVLHITPKLWDTSIKDYKNMTIMEKIVSSELSDYTTLFSRNKFDFFEIFDKGYNNAKKNKNYLDTILL